MKMGRAIYCRKILVANDRYCSNKNKKREKKWFTFPP
jgi:hypothetical protein